MRERSGGRKNDKRPQTKTQSRTSAMTTYFNLVGTEMFAMEERRYIIWIHIKFNGDRQVIQSTENGIAHNSWHSINQSIHSSSQHHTNQDDNIQSKSCCTANDHTRSHIIIYGTRVRPLYTVTASDNIVPPHRHLLHNAPSHRTIVLLLFQFPSILGRHLLHRLPSRVPLLFECRGRCPPILIFLGHLLVQLLVHLLEDADNVQCE